MNIRASLGSKTQRMFMMFSRFISLCTRSRVRSMRFSSTGEKKTRLIEEIEGNCFMGSPPCSIDWTGLGEIRLRGTKTPGKNECSKNSGATI
ncbi:hypothetical protein RSal33209_3543 [Renibacterium salmoninarum ATCC 33209]|uniref:Uncharacterized protein n=1 Tax=Renibacterium salmoninarum (strain ATCC 33209 / DSM 20767 / JCM 11484 / NBRC 15589 / NCIMB 2235) TaxID=288705 RepID=A9WVN1_RENSM|nr:hypothetical protein RSal33209_3543 [Renibacterium salmoninarum ATCC 33209]